MVGKRAQAAMEFMMTYGWAILVVLVGVGALAFYGVLDPGQFAQEACLLGPGFACDDYSITRETVFNANPHNNIGIIVRNGLGARLDFFVVYIDENADACAGFSGWLAGPDPRFGLAQSFFEDGEARALLTTDLGLAFSLPTPGIACFDYFSVVDTCCNTINDPTTAASICNIGACSTAPILQTGDKFIEDLVVVYRVAGSDIVHYRVGTLATHVE